MNTIKSRFIKIGNSRGLRVPKVLIEQLQLDGEVELSVENKMLIVRSAKNQRNGWDEKFSTMSENKDDTTILDEIANTFDETEWRW